MLNSHHQSQQRRPSASSWHIKYTNSRRQKKTPTHTERQGGGEGETQRITKNKRRHLTHTHYVVFFFGYFIWWSGSVIVGLGFPFRFECVRACLWAHLFIVDACCIILTFSCSIPIILYNFNQYFTTIYCYGSRSQFWHSHSFKKSSRSFFLEKPVKTSTECLNTCWKNGNRLR